MIENRRKSFLTSENPRKANFCDYDGIDSKFNSRIFQEKTKKKNYSELTGPANITGFSKNYHFKYQESDILFPVFLLDFIQNIDMD